MRAPGPATLPVADAFADAVRDADALADRLRQDAAAVARRAALEAQIAAMEVRLVDARSRRERAIAHGERCAADWRAAWAAVGVVPDGPAAMEAWHEQFRGAVEASLIVRERAVAIDGLDRAITAARDELAQLVREIAPSSPAPGSLAGAVEQAERLVRELTVRANQAAERAAAIGDAEETLARRTARARRIPGRDGALARGMGRRGRPPSGSIPPRAPPRRARSSGSSRRSARSALLGTTSAAGSPASRGATRNSRPVWRRSSPRSRLTPISADRAPQVAVAALVDRREQAQAVAVMHATLTEERTRHGEELEAAQRIARTADAQIAAILADTGLADEAALEAAIARSRAHADALGRIAALEDRMRESHGKTVDELADESAQLGDQEIAPKLEALGAELDELGARWQDESARVGALTNRRRQITASGDAAEAMEHAQLALADVANLADEYVQVVLARRLLEEQISAYRAQHQQPLMLRAERAVCRADPGTLRGPRY